MDLQECLLINRNNINQSIIATSTKYNAKQLVGADELTASLPHKIGTRTWKRACGQQGKMVPNIYVVKFSVGIPSKYQAKMESHATSGNLEDGDR